MDFSPLFWPIKLKGNTIFVLDETLLPGSVKYIKVKNYRQAASAIRRMKTRAVGQVLLVLYAFVQLIRRTRDKNKLALELKKAAQALNASRPTLPFKVLTDMVLGWAKNNEPLEKNILKFLEMLKARRIAQAKNASRLLKNGDAVLTHCNVSGLMPLIAQVALKENKRIRFFVTETRPYLQGSRLTAWELKHANIDTVIITDNMVAQVMSEGKIDKVIVGADHLAKNGDIANKIGTYQIALLAKHFKIPFYVLCPPVSKSRHGGEIKIEVRPDKELLEFCGIRLAPKGAKAYYPAFDVTPDNLITGHIYL